LKIKNAGERRRRKRCVQLKKLERMHPDTRRRRTLRNWLDIMTDFRWSHQSKDNLNLKKGREDPNEDHYGLDRVKERIIEALAVRKLMEKPKGSILVSSAAGSR
jgi:ATP-dependent Lon protease